MPMDMDESGNELIQPDQTNAFASNNTATQEIAVAPKRKEDDPAFENEESLRCKSQQRHALANVLRKMLAVWIFQIVFCLVIFVGEYNNKLSDRTKVGDYDWEEIRDDAMGREF